MAFVSVAGTYVAKMFAFVIYGQIWSWNGDESCKSNVVAAKEAYWYRQILFLVLPFWETSFLDLQEVWGVDGRGMALDLLFSWIPTCFHI